jgi:hypothetical protein
MAWYHELGASIGALFRQRENEQIMDDEMRFHVESETERLVAEGMAPDEARRRAMVSFGGIERHKEAVRDERGARWVEDLAQDIRYAWRTLTRRPGFTSVAAITLALGIGATTALFGVVKTVLLTPLPYGEPAGIVSVWSAWRGFDQTWLSYDEYEAWDTEIPALDNVDIFTDGAITIGGDEDPERVRSAFVGRNVFRILGVVFGGPGRADGLGHRGHRRRLPPGIGGGGAPRAGSVRGVARRHGTGAADGAARHRGARRGDLVGRRPTLAGRVGAEAPAGAKHSVMTLESDFNSRPSGIGTVTVTTAC